MILDNGAKKNWDYDTFVKDFGWTEVNKTLKNIYTIYPNVKSIKLSKVSNLRVV